MSMTQTLTDSPILEARQLRCERGERLLFESLSFRVAAGQLLQIEGANGSGKTTLLRALCGLSAPAHGDIIWCNEAIGDNSEDYHAQLTYVGHHPGIKLDLTAFENLRFTQDMSRTKASDTTLLAALDHIGLFGFEYVPCRHLSAGQRRRVALARLLIAQTRLWILDEPFTAIDRAGTQLLAQLLTQHLQNNGLIVLTSHQPIELPGGEITRLALH
jgi:heme exporter protein A